MRDERRKYLVAKEYRDYRDNHWSTAYRKDESLIYLLDKTCPTADVQTSYWPHFRAVCVLSKAVNLYVPQLAHRYAQECDRLVKYDHKARHPYHVNVETQNLDERS